MSYLSVDEIRSIIGVLDKYIIPDSVIEQSLDFAMDEVDRLTFTTYLPPLQLGKVDSADTTSLTDTSKTWVADNKIGLAVYIYSGTGAGQIREILSNTTNKLTINSWSTNPDNTSRYFITYLSQVKEKYDGTATNSLLLRNYPIIQIDELKIKGINISLDKLTVYKNTGKIVLNSDAEVNLFTSPTQKDNYQAIEIVYHYGVLPVLKRGSLNLPGEIKRMIGIIAGLQAIAYQMGGTYNALSTFTLPNLSGTYGQQYININSTAERLLGELEKLKGEMLGKYPYMC